MRLLQLCLFIASLCATASAETIRVGAAISLKDAVSEIAKSFEADGGDKVEFTFGSSGQIQAQVRTGAADIDVFISAANKQVDELAREGLLVEETRRNVAGNTLVLIVPATVTGAAAGFDALADPALTRLAIGEPKTVPAGQYAMQVLAKLGLDEKLADKLVYGANVRQVLDYVERGEVSAGIVYATDAREAGARVRVIAAAPRELHDPIVYPAVVVRASRKHDAAKRFLDYLKSPAARRALADRGFTPGSDAPTTKPAK